MKTTMKKQAKPAQARPPKITHVPSLFQIKPLKLEQPVRREGSYDFAAAPSRAGNMTYAYKPGK